MNNQGNTSSDNEITEEGAMDSSSTTSGSSSDYESATDSLSTTSSGSNTNYEDHVTVFLADNGRWEYDGKEWFFKNSRSSIMVVSKDITLSEITTILNKRLKVNTNLFRLKLEVHYRTGSPWFPVTEIKDNEDLEVFISETSKTKLPLCVTWVDAELKNVPWGFKYEADRVDNRLIKAIRNNDWVEAREIVNTHEEVTWFSKLDIYNNTALHYAVGKYKDNEVVRDILSGINNKSLVTTANISGANAAHIAASYGNTEALKLMSVSSPRCILEPDNFGTLAIHYAHPITKKETFLYLFEEMKKYKSEFSEPSSQTNFFDKLFIQVFEAGLTDLAYELINEYPRKAVTVYSNYRCALSYIVTRPESYYSGTHYNLYQRFVYHHVPIENKSMDRTDTVDVENQHSPKKDKLVTKHERRCLNDVISWICVKLWETALLQVPHVKRLKDDKVKHNTTIKLLEHLCEEADKRLTDRFIARVYGSPFCLAMENNSTEPIDVLLTYFPQLRDSRKDGHNIIQLAVLNRSEKAYNYILHHVDEFKSHAFYTDDGHNNILHLAGRLAPIHKTNVASGAALQMQRELQWFEELKRLVGIEHTQALNKKKETPMMVFRREHKELRKDGEEWMKKTSDSYTITAALIITIVFAAAITVPGGNDDKTGKPIYETKPSLIIFAISDAVSLFTATTSLLLFLSILTARYADEDFLYKLPKRLIFGLVMLFVSVTSMMIAFSAALYIMFGQEKAWILIPIGVLACLPIASFMTLQFPLLFELISSTYGRGIFGMEKDWQTSADAHKKKRA